jgi:Na+-driven multidrug efflux pump
LVSNEFFLGTLVYRYLAPSIFAQLGMQVSTLASGIIVGRVLGSLGLSVVALVYPVSLVYLSMGSLIGMGASIVSGNALGKGDNGQCNQVYTAACLVTLALSAILTVAGLGNLDRIARFLGANVEQFALTRGYIRIYILGSAGILFFYIPLNYLHIIGKPHLSMVMSLMMSFLNVAGMGIFVVFLGMGIEGMALSVVAGFTIAFVFGASRLFGKNASLAFKKPPRGFSAVFSITVAGSPAAFNNICAAIQVFCLNVLLVRRAGPLSLASFSLVDNINAFLYSVVWGISLAAFPLLGISFGEKDFRTIRVILKKCVFTGCIILSICGIFLFLFRTGIAPLFGMQNPELLHAVSFGVILLAVNLNLGFVNYLFFNYFTATGRTAIANILVLCRQVLFTVIPAYALFSFLGGIYAVWTSLLIITELLTLSAAFIAIALTRRRNPRLSRFLLLDNTQVEHNAGKYFNPVEYYYAHKDTEAGFEKTLGIGMILGMAQQLEYRETFGVNNLIITICGARA